MTDFSDAALRERADAISRKCGTWDAVPSEAAMRFVAEECYHAFIALRDAARAEMNTVKNHALEALTKQLIEDCDAALAVPCQRHGCMWDAPEAHEACRVEHRGAGWWD